MSHNDSDAQRRWSRAVIIQQEPVHEEVINSLREVLVRNGVETTILLHEKILARGDIFGTFTDYADEVRYLPLDRDEGWDVAVPLAREADLVVFNTFQLNGHARWARRIGKPTLGVVHNPQLFVSQPECVEFLRSGQLGLVTLAPHATSHLIGEDPVLYADTATIGAWMFDIPEAGQGTLQSRTRVTVPGGVNFTTRDYRALLARLPELTADVPADEFEIAIVGGGQDNAALRELVKEQRLDHLFTFSPLDPATGHVRSEVLYPELARSTFLLPMLPESRQDYRRWKISAAISSAIGFTVPPILDRWTATVYDLPCVSYPAGDTMAGLRRALALPDEEVGRLRTELAESRSRLRERSVEEMGFVLDRLARGGAGGTAGSAHVDDRDRFLDFARRMLPVSYSQRFQDTWALWEAGFSSDGFFVEFGAMTGVGYSNSYLLERLGWTGIVAEPHPDYADSLRRNRTCTVSTRCVLDTTGQTVEFRAVQDRPALSTIAGFGESDAHASRREAYVRHNVETITLTDLLGEAGAPPVIDFLSIDTEGSELAILRAHDFGRFPIRCIAVEHNDHQREDLYEFLTGKGYARKWPELSGHDDWYVLEGASPAWSADRMDAQVSAGERIEHFEGGYADRARQMREFLDRDVVIPPLRTSTAPTGDGHGGRGAFLGHLLAEVHDRSDQPPDAQRRRFRRMFRTLSRVSEASRLVFICDETPPELVGVAPDDRVTLSLEQVSASRLAEAMPEQDQLVAWVDALGDRRVLRDATTLMGRARVVAVSAAGGTPMPDQWTALAVTNHLDHLGKVLVARAAHPGGGAWLMFADDALARRQRVATESFRAMVPAQFEPGVSAEHASEVPYRLSGAVSRARSLARRVSRRTG